jgi:hypothetical protein
MQTRLHAWKSPPVSCADDVHYILRCELRKVLYARSVGPQVSFY